MGIPLEAKLLLSFGQIRDAKNLHLVLEAMRGQDRVWLVVAGKEASANQRSVHDYRCLALELGVAERVVWNQGYVAEQEAANLFEAADAVVLAYSRLFRSASGVLSLAIRYRRPCLVSAGDSPLRNEAITYKLGVCVEPDSAQALRDGMHQLFSEDSDCRWDEYIDDHTWEKNAKLVLSAMKPHAS
ncbi:MAG: glycosyltransferase [Bryobacterales bacterium]|nr:glycosyltransferase [Bryobacterales bacterium]